MEPALGSNDPKCLSGSRSTIVNGSRTTAAGYFLTCLLPGRFALHNLQVMHPSLI
ncbi:hypothetical protein BAUCODRAFT_30357 [Baudoinia panamericana UAMH 10762]|uniref:Uncharacterized protein n=1 Tax=Baudoinia panamericana (strain UAMH 10762) TaxID=717646 RepID=M2NLA0_BAUPA|nr:uncharacterized protein BAUCODRAFT_30357 [Baudoinia panamericana UAMH 10762]EMC99935.1 hypothetical protein BAUCODRAFT_30357 [Baudoinia panamericana UAMH 10762]